MNVLTVYFSRKGYVRRVAEEIAKENNGDLLEIKTKERTGGFLGFLWCGRFGMHKWDMAIEPIPQDLSSYDKVIICSPVWVFSVCAPIRAFLHNSKGKIRQADYVLVHFSAPMSYRKTVLAMDQLLDIRHTHFTSIQCVFGKCIRKRKMDE